jgi:hypothetical protein
MHYIAGTGTESVLLADYLKSIIMSQDVLPDLLQQSRETHLFNQYCPGPDNIAVAPGRTAGYRPDIRLRHG